VDPPDRRLTIDFDFGRLGLFSSTLTGGVSWTRLERCGSERCDLRLRPVTKENRDLEDFEDRTERGDGGGGGGLLAGTAGGVRFGVGKVGLGFEGFREGGGGES
jgi:hypothetical protein